MREGRGSQRCFFLLPLCKSSSVCILVATACDSRKTEILSATENKKVILRAANSSTESFFFCAHALYQNLTLCSHWTLQCVLSFVLLSGSETESNPLCSALYFPLSLPLALFIYFPHTLLLNDHAAVTASYHSLCCDSNFGTCFIPPCTDAGIGLKFCCLWYSLQSDA